LFITQERKNDVVTDGTIWHDLAENDTKAEVGLRLEDWDEYDWLRR
jgi:hypothetical protein